MLNYSIRKFESFYKQLGVKYLQKFSEHQTDNKNKIIMKLICNLFLCGCLLVLAGCTGGAVVFAPTPLPPDASPMTYAAPRGAFMLALPRNWAIFEPITEKLAIASFSPPGSDYPLLRVAVINTGQMIDDTLLTDFVTQYQSQLRPDLKRYTEQDRQLMSDGSWRTTGVRLSPSGNPLQVNTFLQSSGTLFAVIDVILPLSPALQQQLETIVNTFVLANSADLPAAPLSALTSAETIGLEIINVHAWSTPQNVFFVTGEVANHGRLAVANVPVRVVLKTTNDVGIAEAVDIVMGHAIVPGGFAPFGLRFGQGQPQDVTRYTLELGRADWQPETRDVVAAGILTWEDAIQFGSDGAIFITGIITNTGADAVRHPLATVTLFDEMGRVIAAGFTEQPDTVLSPGDDAEFTILIPEAGGIPANYVVNVQALPCTESECE